MQASIIETQVRSALERVELHSLKFPKDVVVDDVVLVCTGLREPAAVLSEAVDWLCRHELVGTNLVSRTSSMVGQARRRVNEVRRALRLLLVYFNRDSLREVRDALLSEVAPEFDPRTQGVQALENTIRTRLASAHDVSVEDLHTQLQMRLSRRLMESMLAPRHELLAEIRPLNMKIANLLVRLLIPSAVFSNLSDEIAHSSSSALESGDSSLSVLAALNPIQRVATLIEAAYVVLYETVDEERPFDHVIGVLNEMDRLQEVAFRAHLPGSSGRNTPGNESGS